MLEKKPNNEPRSTRHGGAQDPRRVASRMEGVVKNVGIRPKKKNPKPQQ